MSIMHPDSAPTEFPDVPDRDTAADLGFRFTLFGRPERAILDAGGAFAARNNIDREAAQERIDARTARPADPYRGVPPIYPDAEERDEMETWRCRRCGRLKEGARPVLVAFLYTHECDPLPGYEDMPRPSTLGPSR